jgi:predicted acylesterase/phospholipase RssA
MDTAIIVTAILGFSAGLIVGAVMGASRARASVELIQELKEWADNRFEADPYGYRHAQLDAKARIQAHEEGW